MRVIRFELPEPYPLLNHSIGQSRFALTRMRQKMARAVASATVNMRVPEPFQKAHVSIERHSCGTPDHDGVQGGAKFLIDSLTTPKLLNVRKPGARQRVRNKRGLGFIVDDGPEYATFDIRAVKSRLCDQKNSGDHYGDIAVRASGYERHTDDWYVEPTWCVHALVQVERPFIGTVLDPCCGGGNIVQALCSNEIESCGADIRDRADGTYPVMGYAQSLLDVRPTSVISNPPYGVAEDFIMSCLAMTKDRVCVLLRLAFLEGIKRRDWFPHVPLARVWVSSKRISMPPGGTDIPAKGGAIAYAWFVFEHGHVGAPKLGWLPDAGSAEA